MIGITHDFGQLPAQLRQRSARVDEAIQRGLRTTLDKGERGMTKNLSGGGKPGSYPVPRRTGNLARQVGSKAAAREGVLFDGALYARSIHEGFRAYGNPHAPFYPARPFLEDAIKDLDPAQDIVDAWEHLT